MYSNTIRKAELEARLQYLKVKKPASFLIKLKILHIMPEERETVCPVVFSGCLLQCTWSTCQPHPSTSHPTCCPVPVPPWSPPTCRYTAEGARFEQTCRSDMLLSAQAALVKQWRQKWVKRHHDSDQCAKTHIIQMQRCSVCLRIEEQRCSRNNWLVRLEYYFL